MKAVVLTAFGPPEALQLRDVPTPVANSGDLLIRVHATSVNFGDTLVRNFAAVSPRTFHMPWLFWLVGRLSFGVRAPRVRILGSEFSGIVAAVGDGVTRFVPGDAVFGYRGPRMGAYAEYLSVPEHGIVTTRPANLTDEAAAAVPYAAVMAFGLLRRLRLRPGLRVLVVGASGGIGPMIVQLARHHFGATVAGVCGPTGLALVQSLGATTAVDYTREDFTARAETYDVVIDVLGKTSLGRCRRVLAPHGRLVFLSFKTPQLFQMLWTPLAGGPRVICTVVNERLEDLVTVAALVERGVVRPIVDRVFPLEQAAEAHRYAESGARKGAVIISIGREGERGGERRPGEPAKAEGRVQRGD